MKYLLWLLKAAIFFTLFAFALNNQQDATVHWFFGTQWQRTAGASSCWPPSPLGCALTFAALMPHWWRLKRESRRSATAPSAPNPVPAASAPGSSPPSDFGPPHPPREGL
jgi:putative membrane protein